MFHQYTQRAAQRKAYPVAVGYSYRYTKRHAALSMLAIIMMFCTCTLGPFGINLLNSETLRHPSAALMNLLRNAGFQLFAVFVAGILTLFLTIFFIVWLASAEQRKIRRRNAEELHQYGILTDAVIIDRWRESGFDDYTTHYVAYRYGSFEAKQSVGGFAHWRLKPGKRVHVRYLHRNPTIVRLEDYR